MANLDPTAPARACDKDRRYFAQNVHRNYHVREPVPGEFVVPADFDHTAFRPYVIAKRQDFGDPLRKRLFVRKNELWPDDDDQSLETAFNAAEAE